MDETQQSFFPKLNDVERGSQAGPSNYYGSVSNTRQPEDHTDVSDAPWAHSSTDHLLDSDLRQAGSECPEVAILEHQALKQSSLITIFSIWNTMVGTSILCIPWAINKSGFGCGIVLLVLMAMITLYTAYLIIKCHHDLGLPFSKDFTDVCREHLGCTGACLSLILSLLSLISAAIVYWVLMSNFLYYSVDFVYEVSNHEFKNASNSSYNDVVCYSPKNTSIGHWLAAIKSNHTNEMRLQNDSSHVDPDPTYHAIWNLHLTAPLILILLLLPLISLKSPTFFTKFTALGVISIAYLLFFVTYKSFKWGFHLTFQLPSLPSYSSNFLWTFPTLTGMLSLAYFIHNAVLTILSHQRHPVNNCRDLAIAYMLVMSTFSYIGILFFASFPLPKHCIADNILNNFVNSDVTAFLCRVFLLMQMTTAFPLLMFIFRCQLFKCLFNSIYPGILHVVGLNILIVTCCVLFAVFYPQVGNIIRYFGSICGLGYIFTLPPLVRLIQLKDRQQLHPPILLFHSLLIVIGIANFIAQFFI